MTLGLRHSSNDFTFRVTSLLLENKQYCRCKYSPTDAVFYTTFSCSSVDWQGDAAVEFASSTKWSSVRRQSSSSVSRPSISSTLSFDQPQHQYHLRTAFTSKGISLDSGLAFYHKQSSLPSYSGYIMQSVYVLNHTEFCFCFVLYGLFCLSLRLSEQKFIQFNFICGVATIR